MIKKYYNKLRMYLAVIKVLMDNLDLWEDLTEFKADVTEFNSKVMLRCQTASDGTDYRMDC